MKIDNLKKITLEITLRQPALPEAEDAVSHSFDFIFGIGRDGLTPLETELDGKNLGESTRVSCRGLSGPQYFGHLYPLLCGTLNLSELSGDPDLEIAISGIANPEDREIVEALAGSVGHGCGGGECDCGCS